MTIRKRCLDHQQNIISHHLMSSVSGVSSTTSPCWPQPNSKYGITQVGNDLLAIGTALQSGTSSDAQTALATFQQSVTTNLQSTATQLFSANSQASTAYQTLVTDINSGNSSGAQQAYSSLFAALQSAQTGQGTQSAHRAHHHHHHRGAESSSTTSSSSSTSSSSTTASSVAANSSSATDSDGDDDGSSLNVTA